MEQVEPNIEFKEKIEEFVEGELPWNKLLALSTAVMAVITAIVSSYAGGYSSEAFLQKNNAIYYKSQASDQWSYYEAKSIKQNLAADFYETTKNVKLRQAAARYAQEEEEIKKVALEDEHLADEANKESAQALAKHETMGLGALFGQISIALSAMAALLEQKLLWLVSLALGVATIVTFVIALL